MDLQRSKDLKKIGNKHTGQDVEVVDVEDDCDCGLPPSAAAPATVPATEPRAEIELPPVTVTAPRASSFPWKEVSLGIGLVAAGFLLGPAAAALLGVAALAQ